MENKKIIRFVESMILLPFMTISAPIAGIPKDSNSAQTYPIVFSQKNNIGINGTLASNQVVDLKVQTLKAQAEAIDAYFKEHDMPLEGKGMKMATEADLNDLDWRLLPAITVRESTGGKFDCTKATFNAFGWGSCKIGFKSDEEAIEVVAKNLGGNNPKTARHYDNKTTKQILNAYNPPSIVPHYTEQVMKIMNAIGDEEVKVEAKINS